MRKLDKQQTDGLEAFGTWYYRKIIEINGLGQKGTRYDFNQSQNRRGTYTDMKHLKLWRVDTFI